MSTRNLVIIATILLFIGFIIDRIFRARNNADTKNYPNHQEIIINEEKNEEARILDYA